HCIALPNGEPARGRRRSAGRREMNLVIDNRAALRGKPGLHALIVGLSRYENLPEPGKGFGELKLVRLTSAALTGFKIFNWLRQCSDQLQIPISTCRLLLSPSD